MTAHPDGWDSPAARELEIALISCRKKRENLAESRRQMRKRAEAAEADWRQAVAWLDEAVKLLQNGPSSPISPDTNLAGWDDAVNAFLLRLDALPSNHGKDQDQ